jgi:hypothetical protein
VDDLEAPRVHHEHRVAGLTFAEQPLSRLDAHVASAPADLLSQLGVQSGEQRDARQEVRRRFGPRRGRLAVAGRGTHGATRARPRRRLRNLGRQS